MNEVQPKHAGDLALKVSDLFGLFFGASSPFCEFAVALAQERFPSYVFGGALRDLLLYSALPRDIDIVVRTTQLDSFAERFRKNLVRRTRFGGYRFVFENWAFDIWPLSSTWAFKTGLIHPCTFSMLPRTTFLNIEAAAIELYPQSNRSRRFYQHGFLEGIRSQTLEINLEPNPYPDLCVVRSLLTAARLGFSIGPLLAQYLEEHGRNMTAGTVERIQLEHYGEVKWNPNELLSWISHIEQRRATSTERVALPVSSPKSLSMRESWKARH
jgi:hypothetical protein